MSFFLQAFIYLAAAVIAVPIAKRLGLGSVLGYLLAGVIVGPFALGLVGEEGADVMHFAEFGVVMMLFLVGLELEPARLWRLRAQVLGLGGLQVTLTAAGITVAAVLAGLELRSALAVGLILAMSSTAIALQSLSEKGLLRSDAGQKSFSVLLFQDIAVIPILALLPLLATAPVAHGDGGHSVSLVEHLPAWLHALAVLGAIVGVVLAGRFLVRPAMRVIARTGLRELFTAAALLLVVGVTLLMSLVGLSPALGTFLAGVVLANSEYRHELESDIEPFKGLLLGLFFLSVGASIDFGLLQESPGTIAGVLCVVVAIKAAVLFGLAKVFKTSLDQAFLLTVSLAGVGEFAFVLFSFAVQSGALSQSIAGPLVAVTAFSMAASPLLFLLNERVLQPRVGTRRKPEREPDAVDEESAVLIIGYGRFGQIAGRFLRGMGIRVTVLDADSDQVDVLRQFGAEVYYGDGSRLDLLRAAGAAHAKVLLVAVDEHPKVMEIVEAARRHFPHLAIIARARGRTEAYELLDHEVEGVYRETFDTSLRAGMDVMRLLGFDAHHAHRSAQIFRRDDEEALREAAAMRHDRERLVATARERLQALTEILRQDFAGEHQIKDHGWDADALRESTLRNAPPPKE